MFDLHINFNCIKTAGQLELPYLKWSIHTEIKYFEEKYRLVFGWVFFGKLLLQKEKRIANVTVELTNLAKDCSLSKSLFLWEHVYIFFTASKAINHFTLN